jgi:nicotinate-nucleotide adenylyltransferase
MKVALFGGSFNPPHIAHQLICLYLIEYKDFDRIILIPCHSHPFNKDLADFDHRLEMCKLLVESLGNKATISTVERFLAQQTNNKNYTIDTIKDFVNRFPDYEFTLVIGSDIVNDLDKWKDFHEIRKLVDIMVHSRSGHVAPNNNIWRFDITEFDGPEISSTEIRRRINAGESIDNVVPTSIRKYIKKNRLYIS